MANPSTLFRFRIQVSDVDRGFYDALDFRIAQHPSESTPFLLTRIIAYAMNFAEGLEFSPTGLADPDVPALQIKGVHGGTQLWIEIGNPSSRKLHKASKAADIVRVYNYKDANALIREMAGAGVHKAEKIEIYSLSPKFLELAAETLERDNEWNLTHSDGSLILNIGAKTVEGELSRHSIS